MTHYLLGDQKLERGDPMFQEALARAYGNRERPLCLCRTAGVPMYIARTGERQFILKRMPNSGRQHSPNCSSYQPPPELSGRGALDNSAINEDDQSGLTTLKVGFSLTKSTVAGSAPEGQAADPAEVSSDPAKLTLRALLHFLYDDAGLNRWSPRMEGKRSWFVVRKYLERAAAGKTVGRRSLGSLLLIPENFRLDDKDEIIARRRKFLRQFRKQGSKQPVGIALGEVKTVKGARFGHQLILKHMPDTPLYLEDDIHRKMMKSFAREMAFFQENETVHLLAIAAFVVSPAGYPQVERLSLMTVDEHWLPFESIEELDLLEDYCRAKRHFIKGLRYNLKATDVMASVVLTDTGDQATAVYLVPEGADDDYFEKLDAVVAESELASEVHGRPAESDENEELEHL